MQTSAFPYLSRKDGEVDTRETQEVEEMRGGRKLWEERVQGMKVGVSEDKVYLRQSKREEGWK